MQRKTIKKWLDFTKNVEQDPFIKNNFLSQIYAVCLTQLIMGRKKFNRFVKSLEK